LAALLTPSAYLSSPGYGAALLTPAAHLLMAATTPQILTVTPPWLLARPRFRPAVTTVATIGVRSARQSASVVGKQGAAIPPPRPGDHHGGWLQQALRCSVHPRHGGGEAAAAAAAAAALAEPTVGGYGNCVSSTPWRGVPEVAGGGHHQQARDDGQQRLKQRRPRANAANAAGGDRVVSTRRRSQCLLTATRRSGEGATLAQAAAVAGDRSTWRSGGVHKRGSGGCRRPRPSSAIILSVHTYR
jgi:hypothetical protein